MPSTWWRYDGAAHRLLLKVHVQPNACTTGSTGLHGDAVKIRIAAPAAYHKANSALIAFVAAALAVPTRNVALIQGARSRRKVLQITEAGPEVAARARSLAET